MSGIRIQRLVARRFGPLRDLSLEPAALTVIHGPNEAGKTSCVEAVLRGLTTILPASAVDAIGGLRRGPGWDDGQVELELQPAGGGRFATALAARPSLIRLFVVRDGDTRLEPGRSWLDALRQQLVGSDLTSLTRRVRAPAIVPGEVGREVLEAQLAAARIRRSQIAALLAAVGEIAEIGARVRQSQLRLHALLPELERLRAAERRERWRLARRAGESLRSSDAEWGSLVRFRSDDLGEWRAAIGRVREAAVLAKSAEQESSRLRAQHASAHELLVKKQLVAARAAQAAEGCSDGTLREQLRIARAHDRRARTTRWRRVLPIGVTVLLVAAGLLAAALGEPAISAALPGLVATTRRAPGDLPLAALPLAVGTLTGLLATVETVRVRRARREVGQVLAACERVLGPCATIEECETRVGHAIDQAARAEVERASAASVAADLERSRDAAREREAARAADLDAALHEIGALRTRLGLSELDDLEEHLRRREALDAERSRARATLASLIGTEDPAEGAIEALCPSAERTLDGMPDPERRRALEAERDALESASTADSLRLDECREIPLQRLGLRSLAELPALLGHVEAESAALERGLRARGLLIEAVDELARDIDRPIRECLGPGPGGAGEILARLTGGVYGSLTIDRHDELQVHRSDGRVLPLSSLSRGTRDQATLAVRFALVRRLLGAPGFLVLDDPLLGTDAGRRTLVLDALGGLAREGWQIIYLTFDEAVRRELVTRGATEFALGARRGAVP